MMMRSVSRFVYYMRCFPFVASSKDAEMEGKSVVEGAKKAERKPGGWKSMPYVIGHLSLSHTHTHPPTHTHKHKQSCGWAISGMKTVSCRAGNETFEKLATLGLLANIMVYLQDQFHMKQVFATNVVNIWSGTTNFAPLIGAFLSDAYFGRFRTLAYASIASFLVRFEVVQNPPNICCVISPTFLFYPSH